jgi:3-hydroxyacyl-CoA dehydrogenase
VIESFAKANAKRFRGFDAPAANIACVEAATRLPFEEGLAFERQEFMKLMMGSQSAAQRHIFFAERKAAKIDGVPEDVKLRDIKQGRRDRRRHDGRRHLDELPERRHPRDDRRDEAGRARPRRRRHPQELRGVAAKGRIKPEQVEAAMGILTPTLDMTISPIAT